MTKTGASSRQKVLTFFAFLAKTGPKTPFGNPRAFQPPKRNIVSFLFIFVHIDSHSIFYLALSLILY